MVRGWVRRIGSRQSDGFSLAELIVVMAVLGILAVLGMPTFLSYWKSSTLRAGAQEMVVLLNSARQLAIKENQTVCVKADNASTGAYSTSTYGTRVQYFVSTTCTGTAWKGAGTDSDGYMSLSNEIRSQGPTAGITFTYLGAAAGNDFYVCNPYDTGRRAKITVSNSGRVSTTYENTAC